MGLDMYLTGEKYFTSWNGNERQIDEGFEVSTFHLSLAYWRKHPNLHGYIVQHFANGEDNCQQIYLTSEDVLDIIAAVKGERLPYTEGFFFGESDLSGAQKEEDLKLLQAAYDWLKADIDGVWKSIYYQASW